MSASQQNAVVTLDEQSETSQIFDYDQETRMLTIKPEIEQSIKDEQMKLKSGIYLVEFVLESDILGTSKESIPFKVLFESETEIEEQDGFVFQFNGVAGEIVKNEEGAELPTISVQSVDRTGLMVIKFSDEFVQLADTSVLKAKHDLLIDGEEKSNLELVVQPTETQTASQVGFDWTVKEFTKTELTIQITFEHPFYIS